MKDELTTQELLELTGNNPRTFTNWTRKGWVPPWRPGRGRGHQNLFDLYAVAWAITLSEIFGLWPDATTPVHLGGWQSMDEGYSHVWSKTVLSDGAGILKFLRAPWPGLQQGTTVLLAQGRVEGTQDRFAEIRIAEYARIAPFINGWLTSGATITTLEPTGPNEPSKVIFAATVFNYHQNLMRVENKARRM
jgi:hypothetical protein